MKSYIYRHGLAISVVLTIVLIAAMACSGSGRASAASEAVSCPPTVDHCMGTTLITDHPNFMGTAFGIEDNEGLAPGHNALMFFVNGFRAVSLNPICGASAIKALYLQNQACLGGGTSDGITGAHPVLSLLGANGQWQNLTAQGIANVNALSRGAIRLLNGMAAHGITVHKLQIMMRMLGIK